MKRYQELKSSEYIEWSLERKEEWGKYTRICVSHRWIATDHPDPRGEQIRELQRRLLSLSSMDIDTSALFYDYCSMPQRPRTIEEDALFYRDLAKLNALFLSADAILVLSEGYSDYKNRAWCFFESIISSKKLSFFTDQEHIKRDLDFMTHMALEAGDMAGIKRTVTSYDFTYKPDVNSAAIILSVFQHLNSCKVTHIHDFPLIKDQMVAYFNSRRFSSFGKLLVGLSKYFDMAFCPILDDGTVLLCKPYFEVPDWTRLPPIEKGFLTSGSMDQNVFALPPEEGKSLMRAGKASPAIRLSIRGIGDLAAFLKKFQHAGNWRQFVVNPLMIGEENQDPFPSIDHVVHTSLEALPSLFGFQDSRYLYFIL